MYMESKYARTVGVEVGDVVYVQFSMYDFLPGVSTLEIHLSLFLL